MFILLKITPLTQKFCIKVFIGVTMVSASGSIKPSFALNPGLQYFALLYLIQAAGSRQADKMISVTPCHYYTCNISCNMVLVPA